MHIYIYIYIYLGRKLKMKSPGCLIALGATCAATRGAVRLALCNII